MGLKRKYNEVHMNQRFQQGSVTGWMIAAVAGIALFLAATAFGVWSFMAYDDQKTDVDGRVKLAVAEAVKAQQEEDEARFQEEYKKPNLEFVGPAEYGRVSFMYPRTWSVFVQNDGSDRQDFKAYLHPVTVPPVGVRDSRFALRVEILNQDYDVVLRQYESQLKRGDLTSSTPEYNGNASTRLDGQFSNEIRGSAVLMRVRDKTIRLSTDAETFEEDFAKVLDTVEFVE